jgi:hypothetical protein
MKRRTTAVVVIAAALVVAVSAPFGCARAPAEGPRPVSAAENDREPTRLQAPLVVHATLSSKPAGYALSIKLENVGAEPLYVWVRPDVEEPAFRYYAGGSEMLVFRGAVLRPPEVFDGPPQSFWLRRLEPGGTFAAVHTLATPLEEAPFYRSLWQNISGEGGRPERVSIDHVVVMQGFWREDVIVPLLDRRREDLDFVQPDAAEDEWRLGANAVAIPGRLATAVRRDVMARRVTRQEDIGYVLLADVQEIAASEPMALSPREEMLLMER